ncbi:MAG: hypothetical protein Ct9H300mP11_30240 [Chloroflexota bacterium]|nr:MAG: hypothetical protein Ct9H300mP11_30240 [Chloroflexota bacterium]
MKRPSITYLVDPWSPGADPGDVEAAAKALCAAHYPVIMAGQGVLYGKATDELLELAELLQVPVCSTLLGKSAFPEIHPLAFGKHWADNVWSCLPLHPTVRSDVRIGTSFTKHGMVMNIPSGKTLIQATNDASDINKDYNIDLPIVGDAKLALRQIIDACKEIVGDGRKNDQSIAKEVQTEREGWLGKWRAKLSDSSTPMTPYRVIWDFMHTIPPKGRHRYPRLRQPKRSNNPVLPFERPPYLSGLG